MKQEYAQAVPWYRNAANQKHAAAAYNLGACYEKVSAFRETMAKR